MKLPTQQSRTSRTRAALTLEELTTLVTNEDVAGITAAFERMPEAKRQALASDALTILRAQRGLTERRTATAELVVYACCEPSKFPKAFYDSQDLRYAMLKIIADRNAPWGKMWVANNLFVIANQAAASAKAAATTKKAKKTARATRPAKAKAAKRGAAKS